MQLGLAVPPMMTSAPAGVSALPAPGKIVSIGGILPVQSVASMQAQEARALAEQQAAQAQPVIVNLASQVRAHWTLAKQAKQEPERQMLRAVKSRRGEYTDEKLAEIRQDGGSEIYMMLFATKAAQLKALLVDIFIGTGADKPWVAEPTPKPELPPGTVEEIMKTVYEAVVQAEAMGLNVTMDHIRQSLRDMRDQAQNLLLDEARHQAEVAEVAIEDVLVEGGWLEALEQFLDDLSTFKTAIMKGPVLHNEAVLQWENGPDGQATPKVVSKQVRRFSRVDPFNAYPAPWATSPHDAFFIERHKLSPADLSEMIGLPGYSESAIRAVLENHERGGLKEWLSIDVEKATAEGRDVSTATQSDLIDALQYWGAVSGKMLREWGMSATEVPDTAKMYQVECWVIGSWVIKAVLNADPLGRRPYFTDGFRRVPGAFWHESLFDVIEPCQDMCNGAARALANNMGIASGPQMDVNVERLATGETVTTPRPWRVWQTTSDPMGSTAKAVNFFSPDSHAGELMGVFEKFYSLADEFSGIPRYMAGLGGGDGGAGRTASGMSMMIGNASKQVRQLVASVDMRVVAPSVERTHEKLILAGELAAGDIRMRARGALSLQTKEAAQVRRNEFLQFTANPIDLEIMGPEGRAALLREAAKGLDMNVDRIVPNSMQLRARQAQIAMAMQQQPQPGGQQLMDGQPATDHFSPTPA